MKTLQKINAFSAFILLFLIIMILPARSAVVQPITQGEWDNLIATTQSSWSAVYGGGGISGFGAEEIRLARNTATPQVGGGGDTLIGDLTWTRPTQVEISIDSLGYISARAGSVIVSDAGFALTRAYNQILIMSHDNGFFDPNEFRDIGLNGSDIADIITDGEGPIIDRKIFSITDFGGPELTLKGNLDFGSFPGSDYQFIWVVGLNNPNLPPTIPEPSSLFLILISSFALLVRRRRGS